MKNRKKLGYLFLLIFIGTLLLLLSGCIPERAYYLFNLESVQRPEEVISQYGIGSMENLTFEDSLCKIVFSPQERGIGFDLTNKFDRTIKIIWDEVTYVDQYRSSNRVLHLGTRFINIDRPQPISSVPVGAKLDDLIVPVGNAEWITSTSWLVSSGWQIQPLFPEKSGLFDQFEFRDVISSLNGNSVSVLLPLEIGGETNDYLFVFKVKAWIGG